MSDKKPAVSIKQQFKDLSEKIGLTEQLEPIVEKYQAMEDDQKKLAKAGACLAALGLYLFCVLSPQWNHLNEIRKKTGQTKGAIEQAVRDQQLEPQTLNVKSETLARLARMNAGALTEDMLPGYLNSLSKLAKNTGVSIESLKPIDASKINELEGADLPAGYKFGGYELIGKSDYHSMGHFVSGIENNNLFTGIRNFEIFHDSASPADSHLLKLTFVVMMHSDESTVK